jgi:hypothetical protein
MSIMSFLILLSLASVTQNEFFAAGMGLPTTILVVNSSQLDSTIEKSLNCPLHFGTMVYVQTA